MAQFLQSIHNSLQRLKVNNKMISIEYQSKFISKKDLSHIIKTLKVLSSDSKVVSLLRSLRQSALTAEPKSAWALMFSS